MVIKEVKPIGYGFYSRDFVSAVKRPIDNENEVRVTKKGGSVNYWDSKDNVVSMGINALVFIIVSNYLEKPSV